MIVCSWIARFPLSVETSFILWILDINLSRLKRLVHVNGSITVWRNTFSNTSQPFKWNWDGPRATSWSLLACLRQFLHNPLRSSKPCEKTKLQMKFVIDFIDYPFLLYWLHWIWLNLFYCVSSVEKNWTNEQIKHLLLLWLFDSFITKEKMINCFIPITLLNETTIKMATFFQWGISWLVVIFRGFLWFFVVIIWRYYILIQRVGWLVKFCILTIKQAFIIFEWEWIKPCQVINVW